jgi:ethanolamine utilization protein EutA
VLADGIATACKQLGHQHQIILIFSHNIARTLGQALRKHIPDGPPFLCLDEIEVANLDFLDIGLPPEGETYFPVVVKSLVFKQQAPV